jgi:thiol-disulfide isomerase/thioredoxin
MKNVYYLEDSDFDFTNPDGAKLVGFEKLGMPNKPALILIYASWCGHCKTLKPKYEEFAAMMKQMGEPVYICAIQADGEQPGQKELSKKLRQISKDFQGFPDVYMFKNGKLHKRFEDQRTAEALMGFCKQHA